MSRYSIIVAAVLLGHLSARPQTTSATTQSGQNSQAEPQRIDVPFILAEFSQSLDARKLKPGDPIKALVTQDALSQGKIVVPAYAHLVGHVVEVKQSEKDDPESRLAIVFDKVLLKHNREVSLYGVLQALAPPTVRRSNVDQPDETLVIPQGGGIRGSRTSSGRGSPIIPPDPVAIGAAPPSLPSSAGSGEVRDGKQNPSAGPSLSIGTPLGVLGIKGLTLRPGSGASSPPVILSKTGNVKLENGVQVLVKITEPPGNP
jgi:hypothetical protein